MIVVRTVTGGKIRWASVAVAVRDDAEWIAFYSHRRAANKVTAGAARRGVSRRERELGLRDELLAGRFPLVDKHPDGTPTPSLTVTRPGDWFSTRMTQREGEWVPEYVNICTPFERTPIGFDTDDLCLDVLLEVHPEGGYTPTFKDADDLAERTALGIYTDEECAAIRAAGEEASARAAAGLAPFDDPWRQWTPEAGWPVPERLPDDWAEHLPAPRETSGARTQPRKRA